MSVCAFPESNRGRATTIPVLVCSHMAGVATLGDDACVGPFGAVRVQLFLAVGFVVVFALSAVEARITLSSDTNALAFFNKRHL